MNKYSYVVSGIIATLCLTTAGHAKTISLNDRLNQHNLDATKILALNSNKLQSLPIGVQDNIKNENKHLLAVFTELQKNLNKVGLANPPSKLTLANIPTNNSQPVYVNPNEINFLKMQLDDAVTMLSNITISIEQTQLVLKEMRKIAETARSGTHTEIELKRLDNNYQSKKRLLSIMQTVDLLAGEKNLSGGNIHISFGSDHPQNNSADLPNKLTIDIGSFNSDMLNVNDDDLLTQADITSAIDDIDMALYILDSAHVETSQIYDAQALLLSIPAILQNYYLLLNQALELSVKAADGMTGHLPASEESMLLDQQFEHIKNAMNKLQTYVSLNGPMMIGGGDLQITVGDTATPDNTIIIHLPKTGVKALGMDKLNFETEDSSRQALASILSDIQAFAYTTK